MKKSKDQHIVSVKPLSATRRRMLKMSENVAAIGMLLILGGVMVPLFNLAGPQSLTPFKWIYAAGALLFAAARAVGSTNPNESLHLRRLRRMEFWSGVCFIIGAAFWFYQQQHLGPGAGPLAVIHDTILFTLSGAAVQIIAVWLIYARQKKENTTSARQ